MYHGNDRLINLAVGAVVVIVFLLIGRLKRSFGNTPVAADVLASFCCAWLSPYFCGDLVKYPRWRAQ